MSAFGAAARALVRDPNLSTRATLRPQLGAQIAVSVVRSSPVEGWDGGTLRREAATLAAADLAGYAPARGDELVVGLDVFVVEGAELDPRCVLWTLTLSR